MITMVADVLHTDIEIRETNKPTCNMHRVQEDSSQQ